METLRLRSLVMGMVILGVLSVVLAGGTLACEPCRTPSLSEAWKQADLVVIARRAEDTGGGISCPIEDSRRNHTEIRIERILKGRTERRRLQVPACYGMCDYGLILEDVQPRVIFLERVPDRGSYRTLSRCKAPEPRVRDGKVEVDGKWLPVPETVSGTFWRPGASNP